MTSSIMQQGGMAAPAVLTRPRTASSTALAGTQPDEKLSLPPFSCEESKPMLEMQAGSNRWYQAHVVAESHNEVQVVFPAIDRHTEASMEWVSKRSSRIWRGSLAGDVWRYLSNGAWAPKAGASGPKKPFMSRKTSGGRRRGSKHNSTERSDSGLTSTEAPASQRQHASSSPEGSAAQGGRRRSTRKRVAVFNADDADEADVHTVVDMPSDAEAVQAAPKQRRVQPSQGSSELLLRWFQQHARALGPAGGPAPACSEAGAAPTPSAPASSGPPPLWASPQPRPPSVCAGTGAPESSSESEQQRHKLDVHKQRSPLQQGSRLATETRKGSAGLRSPWSWHSQAPRSAKPGLVSEAPAGPGLMSRSGSMSSLRKAEEPDWKSTTDLSSKSTSTPGGHPAPKPADSKLADSKPVLDPAQGLPEGAALPKTEPAS